MTTTTSMTKRASQQKPDIEIESPGTETDLDMAMMETVIEDGSVPTPRTEPSSDTYRGIFENAIEGIYQTTEDSRLLYINPAFARIYGYSSALEMLAEAKVRRMPFYVDPQRRADFVRMLSELGRVHNFESQILRRDGSTIWVSENARVVRDVAGNALYYEGTLEDISQRKEVEGALKYRIEFETLLTGILTHFINTPLESLDRAIEQTMRKVAQFARAQRVRMFLFDAESNTWKQRQAWRSDSLAVGSPPPASCHWLAFKLGCFELLEFRDIDSLPVEAANERQWWASQGICSLLAAPMFAGGRAAGFLTVENLKHAHEWSEDEKALVQIVAEMYVTAIERKRSDDMVRQSEQKLSLHVQNTPLAVIEFGSEDLQIHEWNPAAERIFGFQRNEAVGRNVLDLIVPLHARDQVDGVVCSLLTQTGGWRNTNENVTKEGRSIVCEWYNTPLTDGQGRVVSVVALAQDITERVRAETRLLHEASHDALTGLPNRSLFIDRLQQSIQHAHRRKNYRFAVLFLDLDRFKIVNDSLGHMVGDQLLVIIAQRLEKCVRATDTISRVDGTPTVARLGGDEFTVLLDDVRDFPHALRVADRIQKELTTPFVVDGHEIYTSASIGIAMSETGYDRPEDLLRDADIAMYRAKALGKARHVVFDSEMHSRAMGVLRQENDLRRAIERREFILHYQPIIDLQNRVLTGFEALVRWQHPERGLVSPNEFIHIAEDSGLILPIGEWVLEAACRQMRQWLDARPTDEQHLAVSVNLSSRQFKQPDLVQRVDRILRETGLSPMNLRLEITETVVMEDAKTTIAMLEQLRNLGVQLGIDDFGTGYSSLSYLHKFPIDLLKIDRSFVMRMAESRDDLEIVRTIVTLAHNLGMGVTAEGVETVEHSDQLRDLNCEYAQGYLFSRPLDSEAAGRLIAQQPKW